MNILLDYFFPITAVESTPAASTAFLKQACVVAKPKSGQEGNVGTIYECTSMAAVAARTDNAEAQQLFDAGMSKVFVLLSDDLGLANFLEGHESDFFTLLVSSDFSDSDIDFAAASGVVTISSYANLVDTSADTISVAGVAFTAQSGAATLGQATFQAATSNDATAASLAAQINAHAVVGAKVHAVALSAVVTITALAEGVAGNAFALSYTDNHSDVGAAVSSVTDGNLDGGSGLDVGAFVGVVGTASTDDTKNASRAATANYCAFHTTSGNRGKNMFYAFGKLLSNLLDWENQQYITMPLADDVATPGACESLFDDKVSFVLDDTRFGKKLGLFCQGGKAIVEPYIKRNLEIDLQSAALTYISGNQPDYTKVQAALLEDELIKLVIQPYLDRQWLSAATLLITLQQSNFVASADIDIAEPGAMWRIFGNMSETL